MSVSHLLGEAWLEVQCRVSQEDTGQGQRRLQPSVVWLGLDNALSKWFHLAGKSTLLLEGRPPSWPYWVLPGAISVFPQASSSNLSL